MAIMIVPMILAAGAAYDLARAAAARAQLQAAVDGAALAGVGAYATEASGTSAAAVATSAFNDALKSGGVTALDSVSLQTPSVGCTSSSASICGPGATQSATACTSGTYCVKVTATAAQPNTMFFALAAEPITVTGTAQATVTTSTPGTPLIYHVPPYVGCQDGCAPGNGPGGGGGIVIGHGAGVGTATPPSFNNPVGFDQAVFFIDGINSALPPASITYAKEQPTGSPNCATQTPTITGTTDQLYTVPGGTYCGGVTLGNPPTEQWNNLTGWTGSPMKIINGNLTVDPQTIVCPEILKNFPYTGTAANIADPCQTHGVNPTTGAYTPIYLGQTQIGSGGGLLRDYDIDITPSSDNSGLVTIVDDESATLQTTNSHFTDSLGAAVCPGGAVSCASPVSAPTVTYNGAGTLTFHSTYIYSETYSQGVPVAWTEQKVMASSFAPSLGFTQTNTQIAQAGGDYTNGTAQTKVAAVHTGGGYAPSSYAVNTGSGDAYTQLDAACSAAGGSIGGTGAIGDQVGAAPNKPAVAPIAVPNATNLFALATDMPPSASPPAAYDFTDPNEGVSFITANERGAVLLTHTAYFCGNGTPLSVNSSGGTSGVVVSSTTANDGAILTN